MDNETALIIEQNRATHRTLERLETKFDTHVEEDKVTAGLVATHERYIATSIRVLKWAGGTLVTAGLAWMGLK